METRSWMTDSMVPPAFTINLLPILEEIQSCSGGRIQLLSMLYAKQYQTSASTRKWPSRSIYDAVNLAFYDYGVCFFCRWIPSPLKIFLPHIFNDLKYTGLIARPDSNNPFKLCDSRFFSNHAVSFSATSRSCWIRDCLLLMLWSLMRQFCQDDLSKAPFCKPKQNQ